jgi:hypothetical protein
MAVDLAKAKAEARRLAKEQNAISSMPFEVNLEQAESAPLTNNEDEVNKADLNDLKPTEVKSSAFKFEKSTLKVQELIDAGSTEINSLTHRLPVNDFN